MGCDYYYCERCDESHRYDYFVNCKMCSDKLDYCDECYDEYNRFAKYKDGHDFYSYSNVNDGLIICDKCINNFHENTTINDKDININDYDITIEELKDKIIQVKNSEFSKNSKIEKIENEINELKNKIKKLRKELKTIK